MEQIIEISLPTAIVCFGVFFIVLFIDFILAKIWTNTNKVKVRSIIKWAWTMWIPLWPIVIGAGSSFIKGIPMPIEILKFGSVPGPASVIYGAFCGLISMAVVKAVKHALEKKGIDINIPDLNDAKLVARRNSVSKKLKESNSFNKQSDISIDITNELSVTSNKSVNHFTENED